MNKNNMSEGSLYELAARIILNLKPEEIKRNILSDVSDELSIPNEGEYNKELSHLLQGAESSEAIASYFWHDDNGYLLKIGSLKSRIPHPILAGTFEHNVIYTLNNLIYANLLFEHIIKTPDKKYVILDTSGRIMSTNRPLKEFELGILK